MCNFILYLWHILSAIPFPTHDIYICVLLLLIQFNIGLWRNVISIQHLGMPRAAVKLLNKIDPQRKFGELNYWSRSSTTAGSGQPVITCSPVRSFGVWDFLY